jgi:hypothetical protein
MSLLKAQSLEYFCEKPTKWFNTSEFGMSPMEYYEQIFDICGMFEKEYQHKVKFKILMEIEIINWTKCRKGPESTQKTFNSLEI